MDYEKLKVMTDEAIAAQARRIAKNTKWVLLIEVVGVCAFVASLVGALLLSCVTSFVSWLSLFTVVSVMEFFVTVEIMRRIGRLSQVHGATEFDLVPMSRMPGRCLDAQAMVARRQQCRKLRDDVVESGRQLYMFDFLQISQIASALEAEEAAIKARQACLDLHGVVPAVNV